MPILPIDLQVMLIRMDELSKIQHGQQDGQVLAQMLKGEELGEMANIESSRVNEVKPHPDENSKIEDKKSKNKPEREREKREQKKKEKQREELLKEFKEPDKGVYIDIKR